MLSGNNYVINNFKMMRIFRKKQKPNPMQDLLNLAIEDLMDRWIRFTKSIRYKNGVCLSENIDSFVRPLVDFFKERYMTLYQFSGSVFLYSVSNAIIKSKTHPKFEVDLAIRELDAKNK